MFVGGLLKDMWPRPSPSETIQWEDIESGSNALLSLGACEHPCLRKNSGHRTNTRIRGLANCPDTKW